MKHATIAAICMCAAATAIVACGGGAIVEAPRIPASDQHGGPHHGDETFILSICKESFEFKTLDFEVAVDGNVVARDIVETKGLVLPQPRKEVRLALAPGEHVLTASTRTGDASITRRFTITGKHWAYLAYWYSTGPGKPQPKEFTFGFADKEFRFLKRLAREHGTSLSQETHDLIVEAVELHEDRALDGFAERRRSSWNSKTPMTAAQVRARLTVRWAASTHGGRKRRLGARRQT